MQTCTRRSLLLSLAVLLAAGCASTAPIKSKVRWPPEPDEARIRFVRTITSGVDVETSSWLGFQRALLGTEATGFRQPNGLAVSADGNRLFVLDSTFGHVSWFDFKLGRSERFAADQVFSSPFAIALDGSENVYISEPQARRVRVFSPEGKLLREFGGDAERPTGLAIDPVRQLAYVSDGSSVSSQNHRVLVYSLAGKLLRIMGTRGEGPGQFNFPANLAVDRAGQLYVVDSLNFRIQVFDPDGNLVKYFGEAGEAPGKFARPKGIAVDKRNIVYVVDSDTCVVQMFDDQNRLLMYFGGRADFVEFFDLPGAIAIDKAGKYIYVAEAGQRYPRVNVYEFLEVPEETPAPPQGASQPAPVKGAPSAPPPTPVSK
jgi:DNA-binding beta-propeller fold protein YncE